MQNLLRQFSAVLVTLTIGWSAAAPAEDRVEVLMTTEHGDIRIELDRENAPTTTANFLRYVDGQHYDGASFYRTVRYGNDNGAPKIEVIQGGLRDAEAPFDPIDHEDTDRSGIRHTDGVISMARDGVAAVGAVGVLINDKGGFTVGTIH